MLQQERVRNLRENLDLANIENTRLREQLRLAEEIGQVERRGLSIPESDAIVNWIQENEARRVRVEGILDKTYVYELPDNQKIALHQTDGTHYFSGITATEKSVQSLEELGVLEKKATRS
ncbi:hypothetical protein HYU92_02910 [Candidatus Curtissbacteria bacterium]|nr:hypothetical protein [Candidatus Curtissbacteria bacterium]